MHPHRMIVLADAKPGREVEFGHHYDRVHARDVLHELHGFSALRRYRRVGDGEYGFAVLWEVAEEDLPAALGALAAQRARKKAGGSDPEDTLDQPNPHIARATNAWYSLVERVGAAPDPAGEVLVVLTEGVAGTDPGFDTWSGSRARELVEGSKGCTTVDRFVAAPEQLRPPYSDQFPAPRFRHLEIYHLASGAAAGDPQALAGVSVAPAAVGARSAVRYAPVTPLITKASFASQPAR